MKKNIKSITLFVVTSVGLNACNFKKVERQSHEGAKQAEFVTEGRDDLAALQVDPNWLKNIYDDMIKKDYQSVIRDSSMVLNNPQRFRELDTQKVNEGTALLGYYNYSLLENFKTNQSNEGADVYLQWALKGCDNNLQGCESISFLKRDPKSVEVITAILKRKQETLKVDEYYKLIQLGFEVNNRLRTQELEMMYIVKAKEYFEFLDKAGKAQADNKDRHAKLFQMILSQNIINKNDPKMVAWLEKLEPWKYSRFDNAYTQLGSIKVFEVAAKNFIYDDKNLSKSLKNVITDLKASKDTLGMSFHNSIAEIQEDIAKGNIENVYKNLSDDEKKRVKVAAIKEVVFKNFKLDIQELLSNSFYNEYFYMVDRLYRGHIGLEEANLFWEGTKKDQVQLARSIEMYMKAELLKMVFTTNMYMGKIFSQKDIPNNKLFEQVVNRSQSITDEWSMFLNRVETMAIFAKQKASSKNSVMDETESLLRSISRNVKYLSIYPNMMVIGDILIDQEAEIKVKSFWGMDFNVKPKEVMKEVLLGLIEKPWFIYGGDAAPLNKTETIFAYYFGLESGVFDTFSIMKEDVDSAKSSKIKFFQNAVKRTLSEETSKIKTAIETLDDMNQNKDVALESTMAVCELIKKNEMDFEIKIPAEDLQKYLLFGNSTNGTISGLFNLYTSGPLGQYTSFRDGFEALTIQISSMMEILERKLDSEADKKVLEELRKEMASYDELKLRFFEGAIEQHHKVSGCLNKLVQLERERTLAIYELEAGHFGKIWDEAEKLRKIADPQSKKAATEKLKTDLKMGSNDLITDSQYLFSHWSLITRVMGYSAGLKPTMTFDVPDEQTQGSYNLKMMVVPLIDVGTRKYFTRDEFISYGLRTIQGQAQGSFRWINTMVETTPLINKMDAVMSLYNLSHDIEMKKAKGKIGVNDVLAEAKNLLSIIGISEREAKVLQLLKMRSRETKDKLVGILFDSPDSEFKGILDSTFDKWLQATTDMEEAVGFYKAMNNMENFVFPIPYDVIKIVESKYRNKVESMDNRINEILASLTSLDKTTKSSDFVIRYELNEGNKGVYSPDLITDGNHRLISGEVLKNAQRKVNDFHNIRTGGCFKKSNSKNNCFMKKANLK